MRPRTRPPGHRRATPPGRDRATPPGRRRATRWPALALVVVAAATACTGPDEAAAEPEPGASPTPTVVATPSPSPTAPAPTATPSPTPTDTPSPDAPPPDSGALVLGTGGSLAGFPPRAPEAAVAAALTDAFGPPEVLSEQQACPTTTDPGRMLRWGNLTLLVRTTDDAGAPADPYVAGWWLTGLDPAHPTADLTTAEGLGIGDPQDRITALYPGADGGPFVDPSTWSWATHPAGDGFHVVTRDGGAGLAVASLASGYGCGE